MYVCVCNAVTEDDVRGCVLAGACSTREVRSACGMRPGCGACTKRLRTLVSESLTAAELIDSITGEPRPPVPMRAVAFDAPAFGTPIYGTPAPGAAAGPAGGPKVTGPGDTRPVEHAA
jgi:bacterioferritin-associated ferredoxin